MGDNKFVEGNNNTGFVGGFAHHHNPILERGAVDLGNCCHIGSWEHFDNFDNFASAGLGAGQLDTDPSDIPISTEHVADISDDTLVAAFAGSPSSSSLPSGCASNSESIMGILTSVNTALYGHDFTSHIYDCKEYNKFINYDMYMHDILPLLKDLNLKAANICTSVGTWNAHGLFGDLALNNPYALRQKRECLKRVITSVNVSAIQETHSDSLDTTDLGNEWHHSHAT